MELIQNLPISIKFMLNGYPSIEKTDYVVYVQWILNRQKSSISLKITSSINDWDFESGQFNTNKQFNIVRNNKLREVRDNLISLYIDMKKSGLPVSAQLIKRHYTNPVAVNNNILFVDYFNEHIKELKTLPEYTAGTIQHYTKTQTHLHRFLKLNGWSNIKLSELNRKILERFENYLLTTPNEQTGRPMNGNTCTTYIRKIKACMNVAVRKDILQNNPLIGFRIKSFKSVNKVFLTAEELEILKHHTLSKNLSLQRVLDTFLFSCYTGLRYSDVIRLNESMIRKDNDGVFWISIIQKKTSDAVEIPMTDDAKAIYDKYEFFRTKNLGKVLPVISNQKVNSALKEIAKLTGIDKNISYHVGRHTFATLSLEAGIDLKTVSGLMGHSSVSSTEVYAKLTRKRKSDAIKLLNTRNLK